MLTDTRDVFFTASPFASKIKGLHCFAEDARVRIGTCPHNSKWLQAAYSQETLARLADNLILCSGVTIGDCESIVRYLEAMVLEFASLTRQLGGVDQGVHNYVVYNGLVSDVTIVENGRGDVMTLGYVPPREVSILLQGAKRTPSVLHQYDRHLELEAELISSLKRLPTDSRGKT